MNLLYGNDTPGRYPASWYAATAAPLAPFPALQGEVRADVCIVGGGYTGLSAALHLAGRGFRVLLLEAHRVGFGASGRNGGQVGSGQRLGQEALERMVGQDDARALWQMGEDAKALVAGLIEQHAMPCRLHRGIVYAECHARDVPAAHASAEHLRRVYGYDRIEPLDREALQAIVRSPAYAGGVIDRGAGHVHPLQFALGLARAAAEAGVDIREFSAATRLLPGRPAVVETTQGRVVAETVILAANGYLGGLERGVAARVMPINNFIVATEPLGARAAEVIAEPVAVADSKFVVNYFRLSEDGRLLFGGGESYGYRFPANISAVVRPRMEEVFPQLAGVGITHAWGGTLGITRTRLPFFGRPAEGVISASGYSGHGVALATLAGQVLAEAVAGRAERFDLMTRLPVPPFPGGMALRNQLLVLAMTWFALRDRLGI